MKLIVNISIDNAAFFDDGHGAEVARILRNVAEAVEGKPECLRAAHKTLFDLNGNRVGHFEFRS